MARPVTFVEFCAKIGVTLEAGQLAFARVAFDGVQPRDLVGAEREHARLIFGNVDEVTDHHRRIVAVVFGGRGGKTYLGALRGLHLALTTPLDNLAPGQEAKVWFIAPDKPLSSEALNFVRGVIDQHPKLKRLVVVDNTERIVLLVGGRRVAFEIKAASRMGTGTRGRVILFAMMDECAFFKDEGGAVNDKDIFEAIAPRVMMGGQLLLPSTPWAETGLLWDLYSLNWESPQTALSAHAPTRAMRSNVDILRQVEDAYERNPDNARREFGAEFLGTGTVCWFDAKQLRACVDPSLEEARAPLPGDWVACAADLAFNKNSSTAAVAHRPANDTGLSSGAGDPGPEVLLADLFEVQPAPGLPLRPSQVCSDVAAFVLRHQGAAAVADGHYKETLREALEEAELVLREAPSETSVPWVTFRNLVRQGRVRLPPHKLLLQQLEAVRWKALAGGRVQIVLPRTKDGRHGDLAQVAALAIDAVWRSPVDQVPGFKARRPSRPAEDLLQEQDLERLDRWAEERQAARELEQAGTWDDPTEGWLVAS